MSDHDLCVLDSMSDYICCLYGVDGVYGVVTMPQAVRIGINIFLSGYIPFEKFRFREEEMNFKLSENTDKKEDFNYFQYSYPDMK